MEEKSFGRLQLFSELLTAAVARRVSGVGTPVLGVADGQVLNATVGVMDQAGEVMPLPSPDGHLECIERQFGVQ